MEASKNSCNAACVVFAAVRFLPSRLLTNIGDYPYRLMEEIFKYSVITDSDAVIYTGLGTPKLRREHKYTDNILI
jgi:hypothetical protein